MGSFVNCNQKDQIILIKKKMHQEIHENYALLFFSFIGKQKNGYTYYIIH